MGNKRTKRDGLTPRQFAYVSEFVRNGGNGRNAAIAAGYSEGGADKAALRLSQNVLVRQEIAKLGQKAAVQAQISVSDVLIELKRIALADISQAYDAGGKLKPVHEMPEDIRRAISAVESEELFEWTGSGEDRTREHVGTVRKAKFWNKNEALRDLGKHLKLFTEVVEHRLSLEDLVLEAHGGGPDK
jgi:phage terminase small subunit